MSTHIDKVTEFRVKTDALMNRAEISKFSAEATLAWRSLQMAKCWLGKLKAALGAENPYPVVDKVDEIPPTTDVSTNNHPSNEVDDKLDFLNSMRADVKALVEALEGDGVLDIYHQTDYAVKHLNEARFWYGFELGKLRDEQNF